MKTKPDQRFPYGIVSKGKHSTDHYLVDSPEALVKTGLMILKNWSDYGYLRKNKIAASLDEYLQTETGLNKKEIDDILNDPKLQKIKMQIGKYHGSGFPEEQFKKLTREYQAEVDENKVCDLAAKALKAKDGSMAWAVINHCRDREYQGIERVNYDNVDYSKYN